MPPESIKWSAPLDPLAIPAIQDEPASQWTISQIDVATPAGYKVQEVVFREGHAEAIVISGLGRDRYNGRHVARLRQDSADLSTFGERVLAEDINVGTIACPPIYPNHLLFFHNDGVNGLVVPEKGDTRWIWGRGAPLKGVVAAAFEEGGTRFMTFDSEGRLICYKFDVNNPRRYCKPNEVPGQKAESGAVSWTGNGEVFAVAGKRCVHLQQIWPRPAIEPRMEFMPNLEAEHRPFAVACDTSLRSPAQAIFVGGPLAHLAMRNSETWSTMEIAPTNEKLGTIGAGFLTPFVGLVWSAQGVKAFLLPTSAGDYNAPDYIGAWTTTGNQRVVGVHILPLRKEIYVFATSR